METAVEQSAHDAQAFSDQVEKEMEIFETLKIQDFKEYLRNIADLQVDFHEKGFKFWDSMIPILADIGEDMGTLTEGELPLMPPPAAPTGTESVTLDLQETSLE